MTVILEGLQRAAMAQGDVFMAAPALLAAQTDEQNRVPDDVVGLDESAVGPMGDGFDTYALEEGQLLTVDDSIVEEPVTGVVDFRTGKVRPLAPSVLSDKTAWTSLLGSRQVDTPEATPMAAAASIAGLGLFDIAPYDPEISRQATEVVSNVAAHGQLSLGNGLFYSALGALAYAGLMYLGKVVFDNKIAQPAMERYAAQDAQIEALNLDLEKLGLKKSRFFLRGDEQIDWQGVKEGLKFWRRWSAEARAQNAARNAELAALNLDLGALGLKRKSPSLSWGDKQPLLGVAVLLGQAGYYDGVAEQAALKAEGWVAGGALVLLGLFALRHLIKSGYATLSGKKATIPVEGNQADQGTANEVSALDGADSEHWHYK